MSSHACTAEHIPVVLYLGIVPIVCDACLLCTLNALSTVCDVENLTTYFIDGIGILYSQLPAIGVSSAIHYKQFSVTVG